MDDYDFRHKVEKGFSFAIDKHYEYILSKPLLDRLIKRYTINTYDFRKGTEYNNYLVEAINNAPRTSTTRELLSFASRHSYWLFKYKLEVGEILETDIISSTYSTSVLYQNRFFMGNLEKLGDKNFCNFVIPRYTNEEVYNIILNMDTRELIDYLYYVGLAELSIELVLILSNYIDIPLPLLVRLFMEQVEPVVRNRMHNSDDNEDDIRVINNMLIFAKPTPEDIIYTKAHLIKVKVGEILEASEGKVYPIIQQFIVKYNSMRMNKPQIFCCLFKFKVKSGILFIENATNNELKYQREVLISPKKWRITSICEKCRIGTNLTGYYYYNRLVTPLFYFLVKQINAEEL